MRSPRETEPTGRKSQTMLGIRLAATVLAVAFGGGVLLYAAGMLPERRIPSEIRFYLDNGVRPTSEEIAAASELVESTKRFLERYRDPEEARRDGYFNGTPGAGGVNHWLNLQYMKDGRILDPARPENLMYYRTSSGREVLVGAMYVMQAPGEAGPRIGGEMTRWHLHTAYCWAPAGFPDMPSALPGKDAPCPPGHTLADTPEMIHVWIVPNPNGIFAEEMDLSEPPD